MQNAQSIDTRGYPMGLLTAKINMYVSTEEEELCPEPVKERCSAQKTRRKLGMVVNGWNYIAGRLSWAS